MTTWLASHHPDNIDSKTKKMRIPLPKPAVLGFFGHICSPAHVCERDSVEAGASSKTPLSASCIWGYRSVLVDVDCAYLSELDPDIDTELRRVLEGYEKVINNLKKRGLMKINEGKRELKASGFDLLALKLMTLEPMKKGQAWWTVLFGWGFFILMWNLMSRVDSVDTIMLQHIEWSEGCLIVEEQGHKGDQTGADKFGKHVYANSYQPSQCCVLALAVHLFACPERGAGGKQQLFLGTDNKDRFGRILRRVIKALSKEEFCLLSCIPEDIGTHSLRKGSSSYALGQVNEPTPVSVYLRMGQSLGKLKNRNYPKGIQAAFPFLLASIIHQESYLRRTLNASHPIFTARVFSADSPIDKLRGVTVLAIGASPVCGMKATGIPAHLAVAKQVNELRREVTSLHKEIDGLKTELAVKLPNQVAVKVVSELRQHFVVNGVAPVSLRDLDTRMGDLRSIMATEFRSILNDMNLTHTTTLSSTSSEQQPEWQSWSWNDGKLLHAVSKNWKFPARANAKAIWNLWFFGDRDSKIRPYRLLNKQHDISTARRMRHSRVSILMEYLEQLAHEINVLPTGVSRIADLPISTADEVFAAVFSRMLNNLYANKPSRAEEPSCGILYNRLCQYRKKKIATE
ncbi:hypothetical protein F442_19371 [Phytophthora nicotianae P10297]|uniref:Uncharacterized protein n=1 Tax=Phytophthora nicotianae P10297 TaxID=1317064 RepID=W2YAP0_PHYNI|nr:hypothetical protein F442_19371 [Phytophthora nicotianae P10297]